MATKTTIEVPVEEQTIQSEIAPQECTETNVAIVEEQEEAEPTIGEIAKLDKEGVLARLAERVSEAPSIDLRNEVEALKVAFYKLHRADMDERRKAFFQENGVDAEYTPQTDEAEVRFKELYNVYRTKRDEAAAHSDKEK